MDPSLDWTNLDSFLRIVLCFFVHTKLKIGLGLRHSFRFLSLKQPREAAILSGILQNTSAGEISWTGNACLLIFLERLIRK